MIKFPKDPVMLLSVVNTYLRDQYSSMEELCVACSVSKEEMDGRLEAIGYSYDKELNQYV